MGITRGPRIVKDKLVLHFDAASQRSYVSGSTVWNNLSNVSSSISASMSGSVDWLDTNYGSFEFDATQGTYFDCGTVDTFNSSSYTKICVFEPKGIRNHNLISGGTTTGRHAFWMDNSTTVLQAGHDLSYAVINPFLGQMEGQWNWAGLTFDSTEGFKLYYNGVLAQTSSDTTAITFGTGCFIGSYTGTTSNNISGSIALAMVYDRVLTADEILQNFNAVKGRFNLSTGLLENVIHRLYVGDVASPDYTPTYGGADFLAVNAGTYSVGNVTITGGTRYSLTNITAGHSSLPSYITTTDITTLATAERYGEAVLEFANLITGEDYLVRLYIGDNYWTGSGERQFNIDVQGTNIYTDFDPTNTFGASTLGMLEIPVNNLSGTTITVDFVSGSLENPLWSAVEILQR